MRTNHQYIDLSQDIINANSHRKQVDLCAIGSIHFQLIAIFGEKKFKEWVKNNTTKFFDKLAKENQCTEWYYKDVTIHEYWRLEDMEMKDKGYKPIEIRAIGYK